MSRVLLDAELFSSIDLSKRTVVIDADTLLFQAAVCQQKPPILSHTFQQVMAAGCGEQETIQGMVDNRRSRRI